MVLPALRAVINKMSKLEQRTGNKIWRSRKLFLKKIYSRKSLTRYFKQTWCAKHFECKSYQEYLNSPRWKDIAKDYKERFPICECCKKNKSVNVHHRNYQNVGNEKYWDLIALCKECHNLKHGIQES